MTAAFVLGVALLSPPEVHWFVEQPLEAIGGDLDVVHVDAGGGVWVGITGETTAEGRARVYYRDPERDTWQQRWEGPTATDMNFSSPVPGEAYVGFNQPMDGYRPTLLHVSAEGVRTVPAPQERLDDLEYRQVGVYAMTDDADGWAAGQGGALWRRAGGAWARVAFPLPVDGVPNAGTYGYGLRMGDRSGYLSTIDGTAAWWDGSSWHPMRGAEVPMSSVSPGFGISPEGVFRAVDDRWVALTDRCDAADAEDLLSQGVRFTR